jgi:hypothetical protein
MKWSAVQSHIVTGAGELVASTAEGRDFRQEELPHYHLLKRSTRKQFEAWLQDLANDGTRHARGCAQQ